MPNDLTDRIHKIDVQIGMILTHLRTEVGTPAHPGTILQALGEIRGDVAQIERMLIGSNGTPGMSVRLDRLEQSHKVRARVELAGITAIAGLLVKAIWDILLHAR